MTRVLALTGSYLPRTGGIEILLHGLTGELIRRGHAVEIVSGDRTGPTEIDGVPVHRVDITSRVQSKDALGIQAEQRRLAQILDRFNPDVVHSHDVGVLLWLYQRATRHHRRPLAVTVHGAMTDNDDITTVTQQLMASLLREADAVTAVSEQAMHDTLTYAPFLSTSIAHIPNGVVEPPPGDTEVERNLIVGVGRLAKEKGWDIGIDAMRLVHQQRPSARMVIAGTGPEQEPLQQRINDRELDNVVTLAGSLDPLAARQLMSRGALVLMPSRREGLPLVALEAAWAGRPVVGSRVSGLREAIIDRTTGVLVEPEHPEQLAAAITDLLDQPDLADSYGDAALRRARAEFGLDRCVDEYVTLYQRLTAAPPEPENGRTCASSH